MLAPPLRVEGVAKRPKVIVSIQVLRAVAAYLVVMVHVGGLFKNLEMDDYFRAGACGIDIFFVISGFIMVYTTSMAPGMSAGEFLKHRLARIVPSYWLLTFAVFLIGQFGSVKLSGTQVTVPNLVKSLLFIPYARLDGRMEPLLFVGWSLNYEMAFYLAFALAMIGRNRVAHLRWLALGFMFLVTSRILPFHLTRELNFYRSPVLLDFVYGMALAHYYHKIPISRRWFFTSCAMLVFSSIAIFMLKASTDGMFSSLMGGVLAVIIVGSALQIDLCGRWPKWPFGQKMGNASYALYLTHSFVVSGAIILVNHLSINKIPYLFMIPFAVFIFSTFVSLGYFENIERKLSKYVIRMMLKN